MRFLAMVLVASCVLGGCVKDEYLAERQFYKANKIKAQIKKTPSGTPPGMFAQARGEFETLIQKHPQSPQLPLSLFSIGELYLMEGKLKEAEEAFNRLIEKSSPNRNLMVQAYRSVALIQEKDGRWDQALEIQQRVMREYGDTLYALAVPLHIARYYKKNRDGKMSSAYAEAIQYYETTYRTYPKSKLALGALSSIALCHIDLKRWGEATKTVQAMRQEFGPIAARAAVRIEARINLGQHGQSDPALTPDDLNEAEKDSGL